MSITRQDDDDIHMASLLAIPETIALLKACWQRAEERVRHEVETQYHEADEEFITKLICGALRSEFNKENRDGQFERHFAADLARQYWDRDLQWIANGLIARVVHHPRHLEGRTAGDFGLLVARPQISFDWDHPAITMHAQGLLVQAKKQSPKSGKIGPLTKVQREKLPSRRPHYAAFVLYVYEGPDFRRLAPFAWMCADSRTVDDLKADFARLRGAFLKTLDDIRAKVITPVQSSSDIIQGMSEGKLGTSDVRTILEQICPDLSPSVTIEITWPDGPPEPPRQEVRQRIHVQVRSG